MRSIGIRDPAGMRTLTEADLPLRVGTGAAAAVRIPGSVSGAIYALIGVLDGRPFIQQIDAGADLGVNGQPLAGTRWLADGDEVSIGSARIRCGLTAERLDFVVGHGGVDYDTLPPIATGIEPAAPPGSTAIPPPATVPARRSLLTGAVATALVVLAVIAFYLFTARAVEISVEPASTRIEIRGAPDVRLGGRYLLRSGSYRLSLQAEGYVSREEALAVSAEPIQRLSFELQPLPGRVTVRVVPPVTAELRVDGRRLDRWPEDGVDLAAGRHRLEVHAPRHLPWTGEIDVQGRGQRQQVEAALVPDWASVEIATEPAGARVFVDGTDSGQTPVRLELSAGTRAIRIEKDGYKTLSRELLVRAGEPQQLTGLRLEPADGLLRVVTEPAGATVTIAGRYRGVTPLEVELTPGRRHAVQLAKPGYAPLRREVDFTSSRGATLRETLEPQLGTVRLNVIPADAELLVDGTIAAGEASRELTLPSFRHRLEVRKEGYVTWRGEVTPRPGQPQVLEVKLLTPAEATLARTPRLLKTSQGLGLRRVSPGSFRTGAPRREQGRRVNETERDVQLTRAYYLGIREVTNREFREFRPTHTSGVTSYRELSGSDHPAVMLGWEDAAAYCNWLSEREQLPAAYERSGGSYRLASPLTTGYRLPTEAEWEWAARYSGGGGERRYPWGDRFELPAGAGNFADKSARSVVTNVLGDYDDGFPVTAPAGRFAPSPLGFLDLGGNAAEWVSDLYTVYPASAEPLVDPVGPAEGQYHVIRGSSWRHAAVSELRFAFRDFGSEGRLDVGFRIARFADPEGADQ